MARERYDCNLLLGECLGHEFFIPVIEADNSIPLEFVPVRVRRQTYFMDYEHSLCLLPDLREYLEHLRHGHQVCHLHDKYLVILFKIWSGVEEIIFAFSLSTAILNEAAVYIRFILMEKQVHVQTFGGKNLQFVAHLQPETCNRLSMSGLPRWHIPPCHDADFHSISSRTSRPLSSLHRLFVFSR